MAKAWNRERRAGRSGWAWPLADLLEEETLSHYAGWREDADAVADAYRQWCAAPADERTWRFCTYRMALEQEEASAIAYASAVTRLRNGR